jgi:hypothetical protein
MNMSEKIKELKSFCSGKSVVLVGNSSNLLNSGLGKKIDAHDVVVRMNHGFPRAGLYDHVGTRTDVWICAFNSLPKQQVEYAKFLPKYAVRLNNDTHVHPTMKAQFISWDFDLNNKVKIDAGITEALPSTGAVSIYFFSKYLGLDSLSIAGFDGFERNNFYEGSVRPNKIAQRYHSPELERRYVEKMVASGELTKL